MVHFDLKSANILLARDWTAKIADVGLAKILKDGWLSTLREVHNIPFFLVLGTIPRTQKNVKVFWSPLSIPSPPRSIFLGSPQAVSCGHRGAHGEKGTPPRNAH